jgi:hypothetical protein
LYIAIAKKKIPPNEKFFTVAKNSTIIYFFLPHEISKGSKKRAYMRIKKKMISANLL